MLYHHCPLGRAVCTWQLRGFVSACYLPIISSVLQVSPANVAAHAAASGCAATRFVIGSCGRVAAFTGADAVRAMELCSEQNQRDHELGGWSFSALCSHCSPHHHHPSSFRYTQT